MTHTITIFQSIKDTSTPFHRDISEILERIKNGTGNTKDLIKNIRSEKNKTERQELKKQLPAICFSGKFTKRNDTSLVEHSGIICLDFDGYQKKKDLLSAKQVFSENNYVYAVFLSPSGNGLKVIVRIPQDEENHINYFNSLQTYFNSEYFDQTSKNISRVCYESFDPLININENSLLWDKIEEPEYREVNKYRDIPTIPITDENKIVDILQKWWERKYPMEEGQRNHNTFVLAAAFNDFGINQALATYVMNKYQSKDFTHQEITRTIDSAYKQTQKFGTKYYEDEDRVNSIKVKLKRGVSKKEIRCQLQESHLDNEIIDSVLNKVDEENKKQTFWSKNDKGTIKIVHVLFKLFLEENGFYKYCPEGSKNYVFVRVTNNLIDHTSEKEIKDFILEHLIELDDMSIYNYFADNTRFFKDEFLTLLASIDVYFIEDTKNTAYLYYRNCAVKITKNKVIPIDYLDLGGYVWKDHIIDRNFNMCHALGCDYKKFISNICNKKEERIACMESTIGYLMHGYKNLSYCPAIILNDEEISDHPEGGTGKGLFMNALQRMKKVVVIDGKSFAFERSFAYQLVSADTQILCFDDVKKHFDFERLFSVVTEGLTLEKKNKDAIKIPFAKSPKISITTNYTIKGSGNSFARRKWELELHQFYNKNFTPLDEFGKLMFGDWDEQEWCIFDNYMISCLQLYLEKGFIKSTFVNMALKHLIRNTSKDFLEWCGLIDGYPYNPLLMPNVKTYKQELYLEFITDYPDYAPKSKMTVTRTEFYRWLSRYNKHRYEIEPKDGRDKHGKWIIFQRAEDLKTTGTLEL
mgnify:CR=1 FL=1